jgi:hypothetical protein
MARGRADTTGRHHRRDTCAATGRPVLGPVFRSLSAQARSRPPSDPAGARSAARSPSLAAPGACSRRRPLSNRTIHSVHPCNSSGVRGPRREQHAEARQLLVARPERLPLGQIPKFAILRRFSIGRPARAAPEGVRGRCVRARVNTPPPRIGLPVLRVTRRAGRPTHPPAAECSACAPDVWTNVQSSGLVFASRSRHSDGS